MTRRKRMLADLEEDIRDHLERETQDNIDRGMSPEEARYAALRKFGNVTRVKEDTREVWSFGWLEELGQDVRYGLRMLTRNPGFTAIAVVTLALGIGANTAIFSVVNGVLIKPLPYPESDQLVVVMRGDKSGNASADEAVAASKFIFWQQHNRVFEAMTAFDIFGTGFNLGSKGQSEHVTGMRVSADYFRVLGVAPAIGRGFTAEEAIAGGANVAVISSDLWKQQFHGDQAISGKSISLNGEGYTVLGVMPEGFESRPSADVWVPLRPVFNPQNDGGPLFVVLGRLKPGTTVKAAQLDMRQVGEQFRADFPNSMGKDETVAAVDYKRRLVGDVRQALLVLLGAVGFVLLVSCANVANLLLARAMGRSKEIAVRVALGARRSRLVRQFLTESGMLALAGSTLGLAFSKVCLVGLLRMAPGSLPQFSSTHIDGHVLGFTLGVAFFTAVTFGLAPLPQMFKTDLNDPLRKGGGRTAGSVRHTRLRDVLVVGEISLSLALLIGAILLIHTYTGLRETNPGIDPRNILTMRFSLSGSELEATPATWNFFRKVVDHTESLASVDSAAFVTVLPLEQGPDQPFQVEGQSGKESGNAQFRGITPDYFRVVRVPLLQGRFFTQQTENARTPGVVIVNKALAQQYFRRVSPIGKHLTITGGAVTGPLEIIGVVGDIHEDGLDNPPPPTVFVPAAQLADAFTRVINKVVPASLVVRTKSAPMSVAVDIQKELSSGDSTVAPFNVRPMESILAGSIARQRFNMLLLDTFAAMTLMLSVVGLYGVISYAVTLRTHEIGIRMALGADRRDILSLILQQGMRVTAVGVAAGIGLALLSTRLLSSMLYGVRPTDPVTFGSATLGMAVAAFLATYIPARRATKVAPMVALRYE